jgi:uncharacterized SAM-binding protein YcdF (DUF218 family)
MRAGRMLRRVGLIAVAGFLIMAFTPLVNLLGDWLSVPPRLGPAGAIVVLGGPESERRALVGLRLYRQGLAPLVVFSGDPLEVEKRETLARDLGVPPEAILTEGTVHTTRDEGMKIGALLRARGIRRILLVTDALSMSRARGVFEGAGFDVLPAPWTGPGDSFGPPQERLESALSIAEEVAGRLYYRLMGYL